MRSSMFAILCLTGILLQGALANPVALEVYYETLCPDSIKFFAEQLFPAWSKLEGLDVLSVTVFPYGNAKQIENPDGSFQFECQHGAEECYLNLIHACVMKRVGFTTDDYLPFILCNEMNDDPGLSVEECLRQHLPQIALSDVIECAEGPEGNMLMHEIADATENLDPAHNYVPWMVVDGRHDDEVQSQAEFNLLKYVCSIYTGEPMEVCQSL